MRGSQPPCSLNNRSSRSSDKLTAPLRGTLAAESSIAGSSASHEPRCQPDKPGDPKGDICVEGLVDSDTCVDACVEKGDSDICVAPLSASAFAWRSRGTPRSQPQTPRPDNRSSSPNWWR